MSGPIRLPRNAPDRYGGLAVSRHATQERSFVPPGAVLAALAAIAALTVSILALRHKSSNQADAGAPTAPTTVYATVTVSAPQSSAAPAAPSAPTATASASKSTPVPGFSSGVAAISVYVVQPGDSLTRIAQRLHE